MAYVQLVGQANPVTRPWVTSTVLVKWAWGDEWQWVPWLSAVRAEERVSPSVSQATLRYDFGRIKREELYAFANYAPQDLNGAYCAIWAHNGYGSAPLWCGQIEVQESHQQDSVVTGVLPGRETFTALGLEHMLDRCEVTGSWTENGFIERKIPFNARSRGRGSQLTGNRSASTDAYGLYYMSSTDTESWNNYQIAEHILRVYSTGDVTFKIVGATDALANITEVHDPGNWRSIKDALDDLIDRRRGLGWRILTNGAGTVYVYVFTSMANAINVGGVSVPANQNQHFVGLDGRRDLEPTITWNNLNWYDLIVVRGGPIYSCFSLSFADGTLEAGWTSAQETEYKAGSALGEADETDHDKVRTQEDLAPVYRRFRAPTDWDWQAGDGEGGTKQNAAPACTNYGEVYAGASTVTFTPGHVFEREIPLTQSGGVGESDYRPVFAAVQDDDGNWYPAHRIEVDDPLYLGMHVSDHELGVQFTSQNPHALALNHFDGAADSQWEEVVDYETLIVTGMSATDTTLKVALVLNPYGYDARRIKYIDVPDAVAWYIVPNTVVDVDDTGLVKYSGTSLVRDDSNILRRIAVFAAAWYAQQRATLDLTYSTITLAHPVGSMVRAAMGYGYTLDVGTVVTTRTWDFSSNQTRVVTGFDELQFASLATTSAWRK